MAEIGFYHCTRQPAVGVAVRLADKAFGTGRRMLIVAEPPLLDALDERLWTDLPETFLAHGRQGGPDAALQPILLAAPEGLAQAPENGATFLMLVSVPLPERIAGFERLFLLFEEGSRAHEAARDSWRRLSGHAGLTRSYWQQKGQRWERAG